MRKIFLVVIVCFLVSCASSNSEIKHLYHNDKEILEIHKEKSNLEKERDKKLLSILTAPTTPMKAPDTVLRVMIMPYTDENGRLNMWKYVFTKVDDGGWIFGDYLIKNNTTGRTFKPLTKASESVISNEKDSRQPPRTKERGLQFQAEE